MNDTIQNADIPIDNPLQPESDSLSQSDTSKPAKKTDPKTKLLIGLGIVIAILLPLSFIVPNKNTPPKIIVQPTPTPLAVQSGPTQSMNSPEIPQNIQLQFDQIRQLTVQPDLISAPQIDDTTGKQ